jgi:UDP-N-acetylmuramoyl-L-alanyl-D-glutamate--2,6-diaminopimelate ligase
MMTLAQLLAEAGVRPDAVSGDGPLSGISADSRNVRAGELFVCMPSSSRDTHEFLPEVAQSGAGAALTHTDAGFDWAVSLGLPAVLAASDFPESVWRLAKRLAGDPSAKMRLVGVTGTNGKTTTAWLIRGALEELGRRASYLGTLGLKTPAGMRELSNTTPFSVELNLLLKEALEAGAQDFVMEVSSHALQEKRCDGVEYDVGLFTNLTQDHLDYHHTMEAYAEAKFRLFSDLPRQSEKPFVAVLNAEDPVGAEWAKSLDSRVLLYGLREGELRAEPIEVRVDGLEMDLTQGDERARLACGLGGSYNVWNCLAAAAALRALDVSLEDAARALGSAKPVPGRFEAVPNDKGIGILVDYAHTPDALEKLLAAVRPLAEGRVITVFGCGGDRDRTKRPIMARVVSEGSDVAVVTSDNPRTEEPDAIVADVEKGLLPGTESKTIVDRREAVAYAVGLAEPGDVVVIAGKGHENYQIIGKTKHPMDDRVLAQEALDSQEVSK